VDQQDRAGALEPPRRIGEPQNTLYQQGDEPGLTVEEQEGDHADERREHCRQGHQAAQHSPAGHLVAGEQEGKRNAHECREHHARERDPEAAPQRAPLGGPVEEAPHVGERPSVRAA
jgi:hypothetical protein